MRSLSDLQPAERGMIQVVEGDGALRKRLLDMGVVPGAEIEVVRVAPLGDPVEYKVKGYRLSLRRREAASVLVEDLPCADCPEQEEGRCEPEAARDRCPKWLAWLLARSQPARAADGPRSGDER